MAGTARKRNVQNASSVTNEKDIAAAVGKRDGLQNIQKVDNKIMKNFFNRQPPWIILAIGSGICAAINGVFAKLTTTSSTSSLSSSLSALLGLSASNTYINVLVRGSFFGLNLVFNGIMWALFTAALAKGDSTTRVSIVNVSANFFITAILGWLIFAEKLPLQWWLGAALLACGNVIIGRREEEKEKKPLSSGGDQLLSRDNDAEREQEEEEQEVVDLIEFEVNTDGSREGKRKHEEEARRVKNAEDIDAPI